MSGAPQPLTLEAWELIEFHRRGFGVYDTNLSLDDAYFEDQELYPQHVFHFGKCLERHCELEQLYKQPFKKQMPLPMSSMGTRNSIQIDKKGLYWITREMKKRYQVMGVYPVQLSQTRFNNLVSQQVQFTAAMYSDWIHRLFQIGNVVTGSKVFSDKGIGLTTDGVQVSVHYTKYVAPNPNDKKKAIRSVRAMVNAKRQTRLTKIVHQNHKTKQPMSTTGMLNPALILFDFICTHFILLGLSE